MAGMDIRAIIPVSQQFSGDGWEKHENFVTTSWPGKTHPTSITLYSKRVPNRTQRGFTTFYAVEDNEGYLKRHTTPYPAGHEHEYMMRFNRAAAAAANQLKQEQLNTGTAPRQIVSGSHDTITPGFNPNFVIANDWLTAPFLYLVQQEPEFKTLKEGLGTLFFLHNTYDERFTPKHVKDELMLSKTPAANWRNLPRDSRQNRLSWLAYGFQNANTVIAEPNYAVTVKEQNTGNPIGEEMAKPGRVVDHFSHGVDTIGLTAFSRPQNPEGFLPLNSKGQTFLEAAKNIRLEEINGYKEQNRQALYTYLNTIPEVNNLAEAILLKGAKRIGSLGTMENSVIFNYVGRMEPNQKGLHLIVDAAEQILKQHRNAQLIFALSPIEASLAASNQNLIQRMEALTTEFPGQVVFLNGFVNRHLVYGGSNYFLMPSLYEPFGLTQREAMALACMPIVHNRDGMKSTLETPGHMSRDRNGTLISQRGLLMPALEVNTIALAQESFRNEESKEAPLSNVSQARNEASTRLANAMETATALGKQDYLEMLKNGLQYALYESDWKNIAGDNGPYKAVLEAVVDPTTK